MVKLYPYQKELVHKSRRLISKGSKGVLIQSPPGSGKSFVIAKIAKQATDKGNNVLFIVHRRELVEQIKETFELAGVNNDFTTIMTVGKVVNRLDSLPTPSIVITDETHHSRAATYKKIYNHYENAIRLGFTATPWRMNGKGFTDIYDSIVHGEQVNWLIDNEFLAPFDYYAPNLTDLEALKKSSTGDYTKKSMDDAVSRAIFGDVVKHYKELAKDKKTILYAHSVEASKELAQTFINNGINAVHADAKTSEIEREKIMNEFKSGDIEVLCNVDLVSEGFNVPDCSCVILVRPTASLVLYLQQSMRALRYQKDKKATIIDHVGNFSFHGLPNDEREWTINGRDKKTRKNNTENETPIKQCLYCHMINHAKVRFCSGCGEEFPIEDNEMKVIEDAKLEKIDTFKIETNYESVRFKKEFGSKKVSELETIDDYYLFAKARGYKDAWIKFQRPELERMSWPRFNHMINVLEEKHNIK